MRKAHWMKGNAVTKIPQWHLCIATTIKPDPADDSASVLDRAVLRVGRWHEGRWSEDGCSIHPDTAGFWMAVMTTLEDKHGAWLWMLNPAQDAPALRLTERVKSRELVRKWWVWGDPPVIISGKLHGRQVTIVGVSNWIDPRRVPARPGSVMADPESPAESANSQFCWPIYWQGARCSTLVSSILSFVHREDLGHLRYTAGGQSLQAYRHLHLGQQKILVDNHRQALALERSCATGFPVRCQASGRQTCDVWVVDVNALYPWVMHAYPYPRKRVYHGRCDGIKGLQDAMAKYVCIARVTGYDADREYLVKDANGCTYRRSLTNDALCGPDLDSAATRGVISEVHEIACYDAAPLFAEWGKWAWELRRRYKHRGDKIGELIAKSLSVSLWGKFAGTLGQWEPLDPAVRSPTEYGRWVRTDVNGSPQECRTIAGVSDVLLHDEEPAISCPAISAFVACYARAYMEGIRAIAGEESILYQCADALHVMERGYRRLLNSGMVQVGAFGKLKVTGPHSDAYYHAPNVYRIGGKWVHAGRAVQARETAPGVFEWDSPARLAQSVLSPMLGKVRMAHHGASLRVTGDVSLAEG